MNKESIIIISGKDAIKFNKSMEAVNPIEQSKMKRMLENYKLLNSAEAIER